MAYQTIQVESQGPVCHLRIDRPQANNTIDDRLVAECQAALTACEESATVVVLSGTREVFCAGADFKALAAAGGRADHSPAGGPAALYDLWLRLAEGPYVTIAHVHGQANAGGLGFVAASDIVLAEETAQFSLSELLFGLYPACVLPFLVRRIGFQRAHYLTLSTQPIPAKQACAWGLVDAVESPSEGLLRRHLQRLKRLSKGAVRRYKEYAKNMGGPLRALKDAAVAGNLALFSDPANLQAITRYVERGVFPWEQD